MSRTKMSLVLDYDQAIRVKDYRQQCLVASANVAWHNSKTFPLKTVFVNCVRQHEDFEKITNRKMNIKTVPMPLNNLFMECPFFKNIGLERECLEFVVVIQFLDSEPTSRPRIMKVPRDEKLAYGNQNVSQAFRNKI